MDRYQQKKSFLSSYEKIINKITNNHQHDRKTFVVNHKKKLIKDKNHRHDKKNHLHGKKFNNLFDEGLMDQFHGIPCY